MTDIICPLCGKPNPPDLDECMYCQAPLKTGGFIAPPEGEAGTGQPTTPSTPAEEPENQPTVSGTPSYLEQAIPDWLKATEAGFLEPAEPEPSKAAEHELVPDQLSEQLDSILNPLPETPAAVTPAIDDEWLASLLAEAGTGVPDKAPSQDEPYEESSPVSEAPGGEEQNAAEQPSAEEQPGEPPAVEKPDWLTSLEASSTIKMEGLVGPASPEPAASPAKGAAEKSQEDPAIPPDWLKKGVFEEAPETPPQEEPTIAPAELPSWLEALRPKEVVAPTGPVEDVSSADIVTAGPLVGLRGVISAHPSAIRAQKPPTYSIKLRVTDEQQARVEMMREMLADEEKPTPLPSKPIITSQNIFRIIVALALMLPIFWMIISRSQSTPTPQPGNIPGMLEFTQQIQTLPAGAPVLLAFDYEAGFSGEMKLAVSNVLTQLVIKKVYLTAVSTTPAGPALAESAISDVYTTLAGKGASYPYFADLGYIPGGTMGLLGLATSPRSILPYSLSGYNVWAGAPLDAVSQVKDFRAVIVITNDPDTGRIWIEQIGPQLQRAGTPLLFITSAQAEPLIRPYFEANPAQVQGMITGLTGGVAYGRTVGTIQPNGVWDAYSVGVTISVLVILIGSIATGVVKMLAPEKKES